MQDRKLQIVASSSRSKCVIIKTHLNETVFYVVARYGREGECSYRFTSFTITFSRGKDLLALTEAILYGHTRIVDTLLEQHYKKRWYVVSSFFINFISICAITSKTYPS